MTRCPDDRELERLIDEQLSADESSILSAHIEACANCQRSLERLTSVAPESFASELPFRVTEPPNESTATPARLPEVPGYEVLEVLGRGGMAVVYKARQRSLNRLVALKMLSESSALEANARFVTEANAVARLHHPNIVQIHDVGETRGRPYLALEYLPGGNLDRAIDGKPQAAEWSAEMVEVLARAVGHAHRTGIVHRDLKPSNILLSQRPDAAASIGPPGAGGSRNDLLEMSGERPHPTLPIGG